MAKFCTNCGAPLKDGAKFCESCGEKIPEQQIKPAEKETPAAAPSVLQTPKSGVKVPEQFRKDKVGPAPQTPRSGVKVPDQFKNDKDGSAPQTPKSGVKVPEQFAGRQKSGVKVPEQFAAKNREKAAASADTGSGEKPSGAKSRTGLKVAAVLIVVAFLFTAFIAPGFLRSGGGGDDTVSKSSGTVSKSPYSGDDTPKVVKTEKGSVTAEKPAVTLCDVTVDVIPQEISGSSEQITVSKLETTTGSDGVKSENYELGMGSHSKFKIPVEVTFPCTVSNGVDPTVEHYNEDTKRWEPLMSFVDEKAGTVSAYFSSFSPARVSYLPIGLNPQIYIPVTPDPDSPLAVQIAVAKNYWQILQRINPDVYSEEVTKFIDDPENYAVEMPTLDPDMDAQAAYQAYTTVNTIWTFCDPMINLGIESLPLVSQNRVVQFMIDNAESLGNAMNAVPFIMMAAQLAYDLRDWSEDPFPTAITNLYKNIITSSGTIYSLVTGFSHIGFTLAFFGVALFGMELDYFIDAAKAAQAENVAAVFNSYYENVEPFDAYHWFEVFYDAYWDNNGKPDKAMKAVKDAVDEYCSKFWDEVYNEDSDDLLFAAVGAHYKNVFFNASAEQKKSLTEQQKQKVWHLIETDSMKIIQRFLLEQLQANTLKELSSVTEKYNKAHTFEIKETVTGDATADLLGCTICFGSDEKPYQGWHVNIPDTRTYEKGWSVEVPCTVYGFLKMGMPDEILVYNDEKDFLNGEAPDKIKFFNTDFSTGFTSIEFFVEGETTQAKSTSFAGYDWNATVDYGNNINSAAVSAAMTDAMSKMSFTLKPDGSFQASSTGGYSATTGDDYDRYHYNVSAQISFSGHIDRSTGDGEYKLSATVSYRSTYDNDYYGSDNVSATITFTGDGTITGDIQSDMTFDPVFKGRATVKRKGTINHNKGKGEYDEDSSGKIEGSSERSVEFMFIAKN